MHVVFVNGPPRSGKDTIGDFVVDALGGRARKTKFARSLKLAAHGLLAGLLDEMPRMDKHGYLVGDLEPLHDDAYFENLKDTPSPECLGITFRQLYIAVSEDLCKKLFGADIFGRLALRTIATNRSVDVWVITDSGFTIEAEPIMKAVGPENCTLVHVHREGKTFAGDSRSYIQLPGVQTLELYNNGELNDLSYTVRTALMGKIGQ